MTDRADDRPNRTERRTTEPSKTKIDNAGRVIREWILGTREMTDAECDQALGVILDYRASFFDSLESVTNDLRRSLAVSEIDPSMAVAARLKTLASIGFKLSKLSSRLTQVEDIAGCRVVLPELTDVYGFLVTIQAVWPEAVVTDKNVKPNPTTGYRAIHVVANVNDRPVEIQLRTRRQGMWADRVEEWGKRLRLDVPGRNLKDGEGPSDLVLYFKLAADRLASEDAGRDPDPDLEQRLQVVRSQVRHYFRTDSTRPEINEQP